MYILRIRKLYRKSIGTHLPQAISFGPFVNNTGLLCKQYPTDYCSPDPYHLPAVFKSNEIQPENYMDTHVLCQHITAYCNTANLLY